MCPRRARRRPEGAAHPPRPALWGVAMALAVLAAPGGCASERPGAASGEAAPSPFQAVAMRAHPLTRLVRENGLPVRIEAHAEFFDRWGHTVKAVGMLRFELEGVAVGGRPDPERTSSEPLRWVPLDLSNPAASSRAYDPATGTYWVRLNLPGGAVVGGSPTLTVVFTAARGRRLSSTIELE